MEKDTVNLSIDRYDELIEAERKLKEPRKNTILLDKSNYFFTKNELQTDNDVIFSLTKELEKKSSELERLQSVCLGNDIKFDEKILEIKSMNYWQFLKFKNKKT